MIQSLKVSMSVYLFIVVTGHAQRYCDRKEFIFGTVWWNMQNWLFMDEHWCQGGWPKQKGTVVVNSKIRQFRERYLYVAFNVTDSNPKWDISDF